MILASPNWFRDQQVFSSDVRERVLARLNDRCQLCGAKDGRTIIKRFMGWPDPSVPWRYVDSHPEDWPWDANVVNIDLFLVASTWPWDGNEQTVEAFCFACLIWRDTERIGPLGAIKRKGKKG